jgi:hypothetical protein
LRAGANLREYADRNGNPVAALIHDDCNPADSLLDGDIC